MAAAAPPPTPTLTAIYAAYEAEADDGFREHLGASLIGKSCERALWYDFRWVTPRALSRPHSAPVRDRPAGRGAAGARSARAPAPPCSTSIPRPAGSGRSTAHRRAFRRLARCGRDRPLEAPKTWHVVEFKTHSAKVFANS